MIGTLFSHKWRHGSLGVFVVRRLDMAISLRYVEGNFRSAFSKERN